MTDFGKENAKKRRPYKNRIEREPKKLAFSASIRRFAQTKSPPIVKIAEKVFLFTYLFWA